MINTAIIKKTINLLILTLIYGNLNAQIQKMELIATGLTCSLCSNSIFKKLEEISEIDSISTDLNTNTFVLFLKKDNLLSPKLIKEKVEKAGFFIGDLSISIFMNNYQAYENSKFVFQNDTFIFLETKSQTLNGIVKAKIIDKGYVTHKEYKKYSKKYLSNKTYNFDDDSIYHLIIL